MAEAYTVIRSLEEFTAAREQFNFLVSRLQSEEMSRMEHGQVEARIAQDFEAFYQTREITVLEDTTDPLIMSLDGKGIVMRREGLREATRKAAQRESHKLKTRLSQGEKRNRKRMATVATVYSVAPHHRTAETLMGVEEAENTCIPRARNKRVWASVKREAHAVTEEVFQEVLRRDPERRRPWVMLVDGQPQQLEQIKRCITHHNAGVTRVLDFIHVLEYLWSAAFCFYAQGSEEAEAWVLERALQILRGKASDVAAGIRRSATLRGLSRQAREGVDACADYLLKYRHMLRYDEYLAHGLPIATGVIEGACRHLIKDRMDITGARWGLESAEAILKLRSLRSSGDFDVYWVFHKIQELARNHTSRYECLPLQKAA